MKKRILFSLCWLIALTFSGCQQDCSGDHVKKLMGKRYKYQLKIGRSWKLLNEKYIDPHYSFSASSPSSDFYVLHYLEADCDKCIGEMIQAQKFIVENKKSFRQLKFVFLATGPTERFIKEAIEKSLFQFPVYFDKDYMSFKRINDLPLNEKLYNTMLVNKKNEVVLFGSLFNNKDAEALFKDIINCGEHE